MAGDTYLPYTVLTSPKKGETAVHCCNPALSVLVMLVSRNVFHVISALQSIVFVHFSLADHISCRSYLGSIYHMRSLAVSHSSEKKEPGIQVATTRVLYFTQGDSEVKSLLHWPPVTFISTSLRNCKKVWSLSTICSGSQSFPSASARSQSSQ